MYMYLQASAGARGYILFRFGISGDLLGCRYIQLRGRLVCARAVKGVSRHGFAPLTPGKFMCLAIFLLRIIPITSLLVMRRFSLFDESQDVDTAFRR